MGKSNKIWVPIMIVLGVLIVAFIALSVIVKVTGSVKVSKKGNDKKTEVTEEKESEETAYVYGYELDDFSVTASGASSQATESTESTEGTESTETTTDPLTDPAAYILPNSATVALTDADLAGLTAQQLTYAYNEIYARHGKVFESTELNNYFLGKTWYVANTAYADTELTDVEVANATLISTYQTNNALEYAPQ